MDNQLACPLCTTQFSDQKLPRLLTMCGHTYCESCVQTIIVPKGQNKFKVVCPEDGNACQINDNNINQFPKNLALLKVIESNKSKSSFKDSSFDMSRIAKQQQVQQDDDTKQLITAIKQSQQDSTQSLSKQPQNKQYQKQDNSLLQQQQKTEKQENKKQEIQKPVKQDNQQQHQQQNNIMQQKQQSDQDQNMCLLHQKPLQIVCIVDLERICAKCAIFGEHKGHDFKSIQQIQQENQKFNVQLVEVYNQKEEILKRIQNKITKADLLSILSVNKQNISKQIKQRFKKLSDMIKNQQKKALARLQKVIQKTQKDIDELYKIQPQTLQKYEEWQKLSFEKLQICERGSFQQKLQLLLIDEAKKDANTINLGKQIIQEIKTQEDHIINKAQLFLSNINLKTNDKIFEFVQSFVQVLDKPPESEPKQQQIKIQSPKKNQIFSQKIIQKSSDKKQSQQDLLNVDEHHEMMNYQQEKIETPVRQFMKTVDNIKLEDVTFIPKIQSKIFKEESKSFIQIPSSKLLLKNDKQPQIISQASHTSRDSSFISEKCVRPTKKKLKSIKIPQKYEKIMDSLYSDTLDTLDLTNAQLGDNIIFQICEFIPGTKIKTIKFIRNKLSDDILVKILPMITNVITLNLSQNNFTERALDILVEHRHMLPKVKSIILSMNKIIERKHKKQIDQLRKLDVTVSV